MNKENFLDLFTTIRSDTARDTKLFADFIKCESVSLDERWEVFENAPNSLKNTECYIVHFEWESKYGEISWYDDFYKDKYALVEMVQVVESMTEEDYQTKAPRYTEEQINDMKQEILSRNLGSFTNDW